MNAEYQLPPNGYQCLPLSRYSLEAAIADAIYYNDLCSLDKGLENISVALDIAKHPRLEELVAAQDLQNQLLQKQLTGLDFEKQKMDKQKQIDQESAATSGSGSAKAVRVPVSVTFMAKRDGLPVPKSVLFTNDTSTAVTFNAGGIDQSEREGIYNCTR